MSAGTGFATVPLPWKSGTHASSPSAIWLESEVILHIPTTMGGGGGSNLKKKLLWGVVA